MEAINMLRSKSEEKRTLGLIKASKLCNDHAMLTRVFDTVGARFLDRLVNSGSDDDQVVLYEDVDVLRAISCVPESESSQEIVSMIPCLLDILKRGACSAITDACYQFLFLVSTTLHNGLATLYEYNGVSVLVSCMASLPDGSCSLNLAIRLVKSMLCDLPVEERIYKEFPSELSQLVIITARQFALLHNGLKFEVLKLLSTLLSSEYASPLHDALRLMSNEDWSTNIRFGIEAVLRNRDASTENFHALVLAESLMSILGENTGEMLGRSNTSDMDTWWLHDFSS
ncbi:hypothetical protein IFM89_025541 [Coptis chinensis]|uniref:Uncharacterized protein n=1 Tax=Coptis chinensis TaxID=261450 RepID=A0A835HNQ7_9MAGN|nr:hypothetical protein IFM89_025541 [Coptis chinensis]